MWKAEVKRRSFRARSFCYVLAERYRNDFLLRLVVWTCEGEKLNDEIPCTTMKSWGSNPSGNWLMHVRFILITFILHKYFCDIFMFDQTKIAQNLFSADFANLLSFWFEQTAELSKQLFYIMGVFPSLDNHLIVDPISYPLQTIIHIGRVSLAVEK